MTIIATSTGRAAVLPIYVGQGYGRRPWRKKGAAQRSMALIATGDAVGPEIIASLETQEQAWAEEIRVIALYGRICDGGTLYNKTLAAPVVDLPMAA